MGRLEEKRNALIFGTTETVDPPLTVTAGALSAEIENGNIRYIRWKGIEVLRAISFIVRDTRWGTYKPALSNVASWADAGSFRFSYDGSCTGGEGSFGFHAEIEAHADGWLSFSAHGLSEDGFATNRTGFVVLHGLEGVTGHEVTVEHTSGEYSHAIFPELVDPTQPIFDIRGLTHEPVPGLSVSVRMTGDAFEMEDQRNWTDASYKTYVRPLSRGFPYRIEKGERLEQAVELTISDKRSEAGVAGDPPRKVEIKECAGTMPEIGLAIGDADIDLVHASRPSLTPSYYVLRIDARRPPAVDRLAALAKLSAAVDLDIVVAGVDIERELSPIGDMLQRSGLQPGRVLVTPARDLRSRPANQLPKGEADYAVILAAARRQFPGVRIGGGMVVGFPELSRNRPAGGIDFLVHSTQAIVHAADDRSVMETLEALPHVIRTARSFAPDVDYRLGPGTIGAPAAFYAVPPSANSDNVRLPTADFDPRQRGLFAAAFALGYAATAAGSDVPLVTLGAMSGGAGVADADGRLRPIGIIIEALSRLAGLPRLDLDVTGRGFAALGAMTTDGPRLWLANLTSSPIAVALEGAGFSRIRMIDAEALMNGLPNLSEPWAGGAVHLDSYALACLEA